MSKRAVLYARVSGDDRGKEGRNLAGQLEMGREHARHSGYGVVEAISEDDKGASGYELDLPGLNRILDMAAAGEFDVLIVREIDRLSRNIAKQLTIESELNRHGVTIEYVLGAYPDTPEGRLNKHIRASIAEYEREQITMRMTRGRRLKVKGGGVLAAQRPPFGYRLESEQHHFSLAIQEAEAAIVRLIFEWYTAGDAAEGVPPLSVYAIQRKLTALSVPTPADLNPLKAGTKQRGPGEWNTATIYRILRNGTYTGEWRYGKRNTRKRKTNAPESHITVNVPALVSPATWEAAQRRIVFNKHNGDRASKHEYLLRGCLTCGDCMGGMASTCVTSRGRPYLYYQCWAKDPAHTRRKCNAKTFRVSEIDAAVWAWVKQFLIDPQALNESLDAVQALCEREAAPVRERIAAIDGLADDHRRQLKRLLDLYLSGEFERDMLTDRKARLEATIAALESERAKLAAMLEKKIISDARRRAILAFANNQKEKVELATRHFEIRRTLIQELEVKATLTREAGQEVVYVSCVLGEERLCAESLTLSGTRRKTPYELRLQRTGQPGHPHPRRDAEQHRHHLPRQDLQLGPAQFYLADDVRPGLLRD
jgi:site-specific DNA recombinase